MEFRGDCVAVRFSTEFCRRSILTVESRHEIGRTAAESACRGDEL
jgi:hypothetical protein